jgi:hypothetical protein
MRRWTLKQGDDVLGVLEERSVDMFVVECSFAPTAAFERVRELFERKATLAEDLGADESARVDEFDALEVATCPPALEMLDEQGNLVDFGILHVEGSRAGFRVA